MFIRVLIGVLALLGSSMAFTGSANAQATRTWISGVGDDVNPCSRTAPCKTFAGAISKTAAGGEIDCLDPGGFGALTIAKSITIDCGEGMSGAAGGISGSGTNGININAAVTDRIVIRNLVINGGTLVTPGVAGIRVLAAGSVTVQHVSIFGFGSGVGSGIDVVPSASGNTTKVFLRDVEVYNNLLVGINIAPTNGALVKGMLENVLVTNNGTNGLLVADNGSVSVRNSRFAGNGSKGVFAKSTTLAAQINLDGVLIANNTGQGITSQGTNAVVRIADCGIYGNSTGVLASGGMVLSFGDNRIAGNGTDGTPSMMLMPQ